MKITPLQIGDVLLIEPDRVIDQRGFFSETYRADRLAEAGFSTPFVQDNHSFSAARHTLRGLHYQRPPHAQAKLVRCTQGAILDVALDARAGSPTYGRWVAAELSAENGRQLLMPKGFLHGFLTLRDNTEVQYKCTDVYAPECDGAVRWDSAGIDWGLAEAPVISPKDGAAPAFADWRSPFVWEGQS